MQLETTTRMALASNLFRLDRTPDAWRLVSSLVLFWTSTKNRILRWSVIKSVNFFRFVASFILLNEECIVKG